MPSARAETQPAAMGTAERAWRLNTASRLQPGNRKNDVSSCLLNPELRQVARNRESSERAALFMVVWVSTPRKAVGGCGGADNVVRGGDDAEREESKAS